MAGWELTIGPWNTSSHSLAAWLALEAAGLEVTIRRLDTGDPEVARRVEELSPGRRLPVLRRDEMPVAWELWAILEFAAERAPQLWPLDPDDRARARSIVAEVLGFVAFQTYLPMDFTGRFDPPATLLRPVEREAVRLRAIWAECRERNRAGGPFLFGDFGLIDAAMVPFVARFRTYGLPLGPLEQAYVETLLALDAVLYWEEQARIERGEDAGARAVAPASRATAGALSGSAASPASRVSLSPPSSSAPNPIASTSAVATAGDGTGEEAPSERWAPPAAAPSPVAARASVAKSASPPDHGDAGPRPRGEVSTAKAGLSPRRPLFATPRALRGRPPQETMAGFGPLPTGPTAPPVAPQPETVQTSASKPPPTRGDEPEAGSPRGVGRMPPVKPIGLGQRRRR